MCVSVSNTTCQPAGMATQPLLAGTLLCIPHSVLLLASHLATGWIFVHIFLLEVLRLQGRGSKCGDRAPTPYPLCVHEGQDAEDRTRRRGQRTGQDAGQRTEGRTRGRGQRTGQDAGQRAEGRTLRAEPETADGAPGGAVVPREQVLADSFRALLSGRS